MEASIEMHPEREGALPSPAGFEYFFRLHYPVVVRIAYRVVGDAHLAQDVAQDVFIAAHRRFPEPHGSDHAAAWVRTAAAHLGLNAVRGRRRREDRQQRNDLDSPASGPEDVALSRESEAEVRAALARLPRNAATVLVLRHSGLSYAEVADSMGVKIGQVGTMLRRAEAALRKEMEHAPHS